VTPPPSQGPPAGEHVGAYQLLRLIAEGGMGKVYLAARADDVYQKLVAIKLVRTDFSQSDIAAVRFRTERQILATLDHPNIARLLDGGVTANGVPYLVMEFVDGIPITEYCTSRRLSLEERLRLFSTVCAAVDYAHKNLVVHRDIKPANILVTAEGTPKLLDFGIAKLVDPDMVEQSLTKTVDRMMTPEYASPEQIRGDGITTSTDVYALGVLLYELLAGRRPFQLATRSPFEVAREICEVEPVAPSVACKANPLLAVPDAQHVLPGELDNIVLMAMRKEPARRYMSVGALAGDVQAYLSGYPVHARTDTWSYRSGKFIRRHRTAVTLAGLMVLSLIAFSIGMGLLAKRANRERTTAQREAQLLASIFQAATPDQARGHEITARELLDQGAARAERELAAEPEMQATMLDNIGDSYLRLGVYDRGEEILQRAYDLRKRAGSNLDFATTETSLATALRLQGKYDKADPLFRDALKIRQAKLGSNNMQVADSLSALGECLYFEDHFSEAEPLLRQALAINRNLDPHAGLDTRNYLALVVERSGNYPEAVQLLREALDISQRQNETDSPDYANTMHNLAGALMDAGDLSEAEDMERQDLALRRKILGNDHPDRGYSLNNLGWLLLEKGEPEAARPPLEENLKILRKQLGEQHPRVGVGLNNWGHMLEEEGDYTGADKSYQQSLAILEKASGPKSWAVAKVLFNEGNLELDRGDDAAAEKYARQALEMHRALGGDEIPDVASDLILLAEARRFQQDLAGAEPLLRQALAIREKKFPRAHPQLIAAQVRLGEVLVEEGKAQDAEPILEQAMQAAHTPPFPMLAWQVAEAEHAMGTCDAAMGRSAEAEKLLKQSEGPLQQDPQKAIRTRALRHA
jgi:tetratricopeptide (TPR) repeat protein/tRNA A-37 threonylcarbamoyl transferase component Bud32